MQKRSRKSQGLELAFELFDFGLRLMRQNLRRQYPRLTNAQIARKLDRWLAIRPGAEYGDGVGTPGETSRFKS